MKWIVLLERTRGDRHYEFFESEEKAQSYAKVMMAEGYYKEYSVVQVV